MKATGFTSSFLALFLLMPGISDACTSAVVSGRVTKDGKPLLWKHRDTGTEQNHIRHFKGTVYSFTGLVDTKSQFGEDVWIGTNSAGFSIMNTASYNLKNDTLKNLPEREGALMKAALGVCKDLKDFETFLDTLSKPRCVEANFGVIDAYGGAAYYETNNFDYFKADANDPIVAPHGYIIRTNFSFHGRVNDGMGYIRYQNADHLFATATAAGTLTPQWIFRGASRSFYHSLLETDLTRDLPANGWTIDQDFIPRNSSSASVVVQGVKPGQQPELTVMWCVLGYPPCSVAVPVWEKTGEEMPSFLTVSERVKNAPMCDFAVRLKRKVFPIERGSGKRYMNFALLYNTDRTGIMQLTEAVERAIIMDGNKLTGEMEKNGFDKKAVGEYYRKVDKQLEAAVAVLSDKLGLE